jgi:hypothetical protein
MKEKIYEELCNNYRYFLTWRHAAFAGHVLAIGGTIALCITAIKDDSNIAYLIPLFASPIGIILWLFDLKIRKIYRAIYAYGEKLEVGFDGYFSCLRNVGASFPDDGAPREEEQDLRTKSLISHSTVLDIVYWCSFFGMLFLSLFIKYNS